MTTPICIYHGNCADGFTAAWAVWRAHPDWTFYAGTYQSPPPDVSGRDVILVDFSYKRPVIEEMAKTARRVLVLDHHKSAAEDLGETFMNVDGAGFTYERWNRTHAGGVWVHFDMERSGAAIAWDFFHPGTKRPKLVDYVQDRDLWRFRLPFSREVNAWIFSHEFDFDCWQGMDIALGESFKRVVDEGGAIERKHHKDVAELVGALMRPLTIAGHEVPACNLPYTMASDAGHLMCEGVPDPNGAPDERIKPPFAACWWRTPDGVTFSLRSIEGGADVSEIAKQYGGGGHRHAAGFRVDREVLRRFEDAAARG